ncbi:hypothetical protein ACIBSV_48345 [Embleya sp. NPDC050154]|uniref:hypothetical protein n=1 Tax=Embleya sp. NPDC050154 TaxID=3363988 RepID=UPI0037B4C3C5
MITASGTTRTAIAALGLSAVVVASGCTSDSPHEDEAMSVQDLRERTRKVDKGTPCPFRFDVAAAARAAGITQPVRPGDPQSEGSETPARPAQPATPAVGTAPAGPEIPASPAVWGITCNYEVGASRLEVHVVGSSAADTAINMFAPVIQRGGALKTDDLVGFLRDATAAGPGTVMVTPGRGTVATARLPVAGDGDIAVVLTSTHQDALADPAPSGPALVSMTEAIREGARFRGDGGDSRE